MRRLHNHTSHFKMLFENEWFKAAVMTINKPSDLRKSDLIAVTVAPVLNCTNPLCQKPFTLPPVSQLISAYKPHHSYCRHCDAPLPTISFTVPCTTRHRDLARELSQNWSTSLQKVREMVISSHRGILGNPNQSISYLLQNWRVRSGPGAPSPGSPFVGSTRMIGATVMDFESFTKDLDMTALDTSFRTEFDMSWCYSIGISRFTETHQDLYMLSSMKPNRNGELVHADTLSFRASTRTQTQGL